MSAFIQPGDRVVSASSDYPLLSAYASRNLAGELSLLVLHKDRTTNFNAQINLNGFAPGQTATVRSYGIPQDEAARTNASLLAQDIATNQFSSVSASFDYSFPPYSMTLFTILPEASPIPEAPQLQVLSAGAPSGQLILRLYGQAGQRYVVQAGTDLKNWTGVSTNVLPTGSLDLSFPVTPGQHYWRAVLSP
jgi:hypothetical protein